MNKTKAIVIYAILLVPIIFLLLFESLAFFIEKNIFSKDFCISYDCWVYFMSLSEGYGGIVEKYLNILYLLVTVASLIFATYHYITTNKNSNASLHLESLSTFNNYLEKLFGSYKTMNFKSVDTLKWHNQIFPNSINGDRLVGKSYFDKIDLINDIIRESNEAALKSSHSKFDYNNHQDKMIRVLKDIGLLVMHAPRNQFFETEGYVLELVDRVNSEFCGGPKGLKILKRRYI